MATITVKNTASTSYKILVPSSSMENLDANAQINFAGGSREINTFDLVGYVEPLYSMKILDLSANSEVDITVDENKDTWGIVIATADGLYEPVAFKNVIYDETAGAYSEFEVTQDAIDGMSGAMRLIKTIIAQPDSDEATGFFTVVVKAQENYDFDNDITAFMSDVESDLNDYLGGLNQEYYGNTTSFDLLTAQSYFKNIPFAWVSISEVAKGESCTFYIRDFDDNDLATMSTTITESDIVGSSGYNLSMAVDSKDVVFTTSSFMNDEVKFAVHGSFRQDNNIFKPMLLGTYNGKSCYGSLDPVDGDGDSDIKKDLDKLLEHDGWIVGTFACSALLYFGYITGFFGSIINGYRKDAARERARNEIESQAREKFYDDNVTTDQLREYLKEKVEMTDTQFETTFNDLSSIDAVVNALDGLKIKQVAAPEDYVPMDTGWSNLPKWLGKGVYRIKKGLGNCCCAREQHRRASENASEIENSTNEMESLLRRVSTETSPNAEQLQVINDGISEMNNVTLQIVETVNSSKDTQSGFADSVHPSGTTTNTDLIVNPQDYELDSESYKESAVQSAKKSSELLLKTQSVVKGQQAQVQDIAASNPSIDMANSEQIVKSVLDGIIDKVTEDSERAQQLEEGDITNNKELNEVISD